MVSAEENSAKAGSPVSALDHIADISIDISKMSGTCSGKGKALEIDGVGVNILGRDDLLLKIMSFSTWFDRIR
jgi:hypothetical protein